MFLECFVASCGSLLASLHRSFSSSSQAIQRRIRSRLRLCSHGSFPIASFQIVSGAEREPPPNKAMKRTLNSAVQITAVLSGNDLFRLGRVGGAIQRRLSPIR